ncbi:MAG: hypothetical protein Q9161_007329 [Pseudevernia consocians]
MSTSKVDSLEHLIRTQLPEWRQQVTASEEEEEEEEEEDVVCTPRTLGHAKAGEQTVDHAHKQTHPNTTQVLYTILTYSPLHPHLSTLKSFTPPSNNTSDPDALTSVVVYLDGQTSGPGYRSSVTATRGFHAPYTGRFRVVLDANGEVAAASWHSHLAQSSAAAAGKGKGKGKRKGESGSAENRRGDFDVRRTKAAPSVVFDKAVKGTGGGATGAGTGAGTAAGTEGEEEVVEKTLFQK